MPKKIRPMREIIAEAIRGEPLPGDPRWEFLSETKRAGWLEDADRVMAAMRNELAWCFAEFSYEEGGVDWLANDPDDLWREFFDFCIRDGAPAPGLLHWTHAKEAEPK